MNLEIGERWRVTAIDIGTKAIYYIESLTGDYVNIKKLSGHERHLTLCSIRREIILKNTEDGRETWEPLELCKRYNWMLWLEKKGG